MACLHCSPLVLTIHKTKHNISSKLKYIFFPPKSMLVVLFEQVCVHLVVNYDMK